ncbi:MAG: hypothetical protein IT516_00415 [Burkholderiales bacterium]|nr:hypothetical protein [Burkholderiales bacterium]
MRHAPSIDIALQPSWTGAVATATAAVATLAVVLTLPIGVSLQAVLGAVVLAWAASTVRTVFRRAGGNGVSAVHLAGDRLVVVHHRDGRIVAGHLHHATYVSSLLTTIVWRPDGGSRLRAVVVLPDMLPAEEFRRLRILLRYARSGVVQGAPASHA